MTEPRKTIAVVGTGVIGSSFAALYLSYGHRVLICSPSASPNSEAKLNAYLDRIWPTLTLQHSSASRDNLTYVGAYLTGHFDQIDLIQECAPERLPLKRALLAQLDQEAKPATIIASSSSGMTASLLLGDGKWKHAERILVGHPYNPPHLIPLVEVVPHPKTDAAVTARAVEFYRSVGRTPVVVRKEVPGFVANRLQAVLLREAFSLVLEGVCSAEEVDICVTEGIGPRWAISGPFMTNVLGGGGGKDGFKHLISHIAPAARAWYEDMDAKVAGLDMAESSTIDKLDESVQQMLQDRDLEAFQAQFRQMLVQVFKMKADVRSRDTEDSA